jgi:hypothetical protein
MNQGPDQARLRRALLSAVAGVLLVLAPLAAFAERRVVAVGDVHGNYSGFTSILQESGLIDAENRWTGGNSVLVQTGDLFDRGADTRQVLDLLMTLQHQAPRSGGQVVALIGNHEMMNLVGDLRYVSAGEYASFADRRSEARRRDAFRQYTRWLQQRARRFKQPALKVTAEMEQEWMARRPLGYVEMREALGPRGKYGAWLRRLPALARVEDGIFLHGGIHPELLALTLEQVNDRIRQEIQYFDSFTAELERAGVILPFFDLPEIVEAVQMEMKAPRVDQRMLQDFLEQHGGWLSMHQDGPLWFRGFHNWSEEEGAAIITRALQHFGASYFVVGHTPQAEGRIRARFDNRVFLIDTGMLDTYYRGGRASALEQQTGAFTAIYRDKRVVLNRLHEEGAPAGARSAHLRETPGGGIEFDPAVQEEAAPEGRVWLDANGNPSPLRTDEEVLEFLRTARVRGMKAIGEGIADVQRVVLEKDGIQMHAAFRHLDLTKPNYLGELYFRDSYMFEPAAYELALLLGLDTVPPVILRSVRGMRGSLQIWVENAMNERQRREKNLSPPDDEAWSRQLSRMYLFDNLVFNIDRNLGNLLFDRSWKIWFIDHTRAFRRSSDLRDTSLLRRVDGQLLERLRALDGEEVRQRLRKYVGGQEIKALMERRDKLVQYFDQLIAEKGRDAVVF